MIIKRQQDPSVKETEVVIRYAQENKEVKQLLAFMNSMEEKILCAGGRFVRASEIYYIESVDKKTFIYLEKEVIRGQDRLYQLREELGESGFVQVSKSCLLNLNYLECIRPLQNSRMEALLFNGEKIFINRRYLHEIREVLKKEETGC